MIVGADTKNASVPLHDLTDVLNLLFKKNKDRVAKSDSITTKPVLSGVAAIGYTLQTKIAGTVSGNVAFRADPGSAVSAVRTNITYTQNKQFFWPIQSIIVFKKNRYALVGDYRFYKYPQSTYGLGSDTYKGNENPMDYKFFRFYQILLRRLKSRFYAGAGYIIDYRWDIRDRGTTTNTANDYEKYGREEKTVSSGFTINGLYDTRDNPINAKKGFYTSLQYRQNLKGLGSTRNWESVILDMRKFFPISHGKSTLGFWSYNWLTIHGKPPYLDLPSNGWDSYSSTGRGYIQGRFRGAQMLYLESEYRFNLTKTGLFGAVLFANAQTFSGEQGSSFQSIQPGFGTGLRIKINKQSNTNLAIDYGFGMQGSKGLFIAVGEYF